MLLEKIKKLKNKIFKNEKTENKKKKIISLILIFLGIFNIYLSKENYDLKQNLIEKIQKESQIKIENNFFGDNQKLKNYSNTRYKIQDSGKIIIDNIRNFHKSPVLISREFQDKELCAGYISELSKKIWGNKVIYSIGMQNIKKGKLVQAWELPYYYEAFGGRILVDLGEKFNPEEDNYFDKIKQKDLKDFFANAFKEEALFGDIGFLYSKTHYARFLKNWNKNSHITKNMGISDFEIIFSKIDKNKSNIDNLVANLGCNKDFKKYISLLENYNLFLNGKRIIFYNNDFYFLSENNILGKKVRFEYLDKLTYKDITIAHFFGGKALVDSLFQFTCKGEFYPINIISINSRMIEKM